MNGATASKAKQPPPSSELPAAPPPKTPVTPAVPPPATPMNGQQSKTAGTAGKKKAEPIDPATMYETVRNRIAALEEEEVHGEEEERRVVEEARQSMNGLTESAIHAKYIDMYQDMKRVEREHAKEKQKLTKDKDASKSQLTKANAAKTRLENVGRELQKENKRLRDETARLAKCVTDAQAELETMKNEMERRIAKARIKDKEALELADIVVKVVCKYRAELFFKISRKTKLSRLFNAWTERMEPAAGATGATAKKANAPPPPPPPPASTTGAAPVQFMFTYMGRNLDPEETPEEACIEDGDEIFAVEMMDLTTPDMDEVPEPQRMKLRKSWTENPVEARKTVEDILDGIARERLKDILRQYELREKHFECVVRSKELEVLLAKARVEEQKHITESERSRHAANEIECVELRKQLEDTQSSQQRLMDKLILACKEPSSERTTKLFEFLSLELAKRGRPLDGLASTPTASNSAAASGVASVS
ncbi:hypothetical protein EXIGLDRAFT_761559 [Exidia glandulosa HHB12029]|uniref:Ubiquitin-like domain-containing protein n=1 Tax=Exidia glandulosa HHB12029 TaxID=1314781 RepID=A0A165NAM1_EXIGL|nr:hypothetical protein EXIGLDRAFT_761559 [Exidia glandulosa HHB12029]